MPAPLLVLLLDKATGNGGKLLRDFIFFLNAVRSHSNKVKQSAPGLDELFVDLGGKGCPSTNGHIKG